MSSIRSAATRTKKWAAATRTFATAPKTTRNSRTSRTRKTTRAMKKTPTTRTSRRKAMRPDDRNDDIAADQPTGEVGSEGGSPGDVEVERPLDPGVGTEASETWRPWRDD